MSIDVESARREWADAHRRLEDVRRNGAGTDALETQLDLLVRELRKRLGALYTLGQVVEEYRRAEPWVRHVVGEQAPAPGWPRTLTTVEGAAFHVVSLGAVDYEP